MIGVWSLATPKMASEFPDLMPNVYGTALLPFPATFDTADGKTFAETYKALYKKEPDYLGQFGYVQSMLLFEAIARAADKGTVKKGGVADELRKTDRDTLIGRVQFNAKWRQSELRAPHGPAPGQEHHHRLAQGKRHRQDGLSRPALVSSR
jgi:branched-chain amino acid transport system substrate-binding protein